MASCSKYESDERRDRRELKGCFTIGFIALVLIVFVLCDKIII